MTEHDNFPQRITDTAESQLLVDQLSVNEEHHAQIQAVVEFSRYVTERYPQVDFVDGVPQLNYYFTGSLAATLLSKAVEIELCEETTASDIAVTRKIENPIQSRHSFAAFARPIGDIDFVITDHYEAQRKLVNALYRSDSVEEYRQARTKYLWKGGGGPKFGELPSGAQRAVRRNQDQADEHGIMCDIVETYGTKKFARVQIDGHDYYLARPDTIVGYKMLHMLQGYRNKPDAFNADFAHLYRAITVLYPEGELVTSTYQILSEYDAVMAHIAATFDNRHTSKLPRMIKELLSHATVSTEICTFLKKILDYDKSHQKMLV